MIIQKKIKDIIKELAKKYNLPEEEIQKIVFSPFQLLVASMKKGKKGEIKSFKNIRIINLGLFVVKPSRIKHLNDDNRGPTEEV